MSFGDDLRLFREKADGRLQDVFVGSVQTLHESIVEGSSLTGAPGQPVDIGFLKGSWQITFPEPLMGEVSTNVGYAPNIEDGVGTHGALTLRSRVGGFHSVKLTRASWDRVVEHVAHQVTGGGGFSVSPTGAGFGGIADLGSGNVPRFIASPTRQITGG